MKIMWVVVALILGFLAFNTYDKWSQWKADQNAQQAKKTDYVVTEKQGELPQGFPPVPVYPGAVVEDSVKSLEGASAVYSAKWKALAQTRRVAEWYMEEMEKNNWTLTQQAGPISDEGEQFFEFEKNGLMLNLVLETEGTPETEIIIQFPLQELTLYESI